MLKQKLKGFISLVVVCLCVATLVILPASAADGGMAFAVNPIMPQNQTNPGLGYFDLNVSPGDSQTLEIQVKNKSSEEITLEVGAASASTTPSGLVNYTSTLEEDETMKHPFSKIATVREEQVKVPANGEKIIYIDLKIPQEEFDGIVLGGIRTTDITNRLKRDNAGKNDEEAGIEIFNEYEVVVGTVLRENNKAVEPNFELVGVETGLSNYEAAIITKIRNPQPLLVKDASYSGTISPKGSGDNIFSIDGLKIEFAPNSVMNYEFVDGAGYGLDAGDYTFKGKLEYDGKTWDFEQDFNIKSEEAAEVNSGAIGQQQSRNSGIPIWLVIVSILALILIILLIILILKLSKNRK